VVEGVVVDVEVHAGVDVPEAREFGVEFEDGLELVCAQEGVEFGE